MILLLMNYFIVQRYWENFLKIITRNNFICEELFIYESKCPTSLAKYYIKICSL